MGRIPLHQGNGYTLGDTGGVEQVTLTTNQIPAHNHVFTASSSIANAAGPANALLAVSSQISSFHTQDNLMNMNANSIGTTGGSQPHDNMQPSLCINFIISLFGIFPSQS